MSSLVHISWDVLDQIFNFLDIASVTNLSIVNKSFYEHTRDDYEIHNPLVQNAKTFLCLCEGHLSFIPLDWIGNLQNIFVLDHVMNKIRSNEPVPRERKQEYENLYYHCQVSDWVEGCIFILKRSQVLPRPNFLEFSSVRSCIKIVQWLIQTLRFPYRRYHFKYLIGPCAQRHETDWMLNYVSPYYLAYLALTFNNYNLFKLYNDEIESSNLNTNSNSNANSLKDMAPCVALYNGHVEMAETILDDLKISRIYSKTIIEILAENACKMNMSGVLKWCVHYHQTVIGTELDARQLLEMALMSKNLEICEYLRMKFAHYASENVWNIFTSMHGVHDDIYLLMWCEKHQIPVDWNKCLYIAAINKYTVALKQFELFGYHITNEILGDLMVDGNLKVLNWLESNSSIADELKIDPAIVMICLNADLIAVVNWALTVQRIQGIQVDSIVLMIRFCIAQEKLFPLYSILKNINSSVNEHLQQYYYAQFCELAIPGSKILKLLQFHFKKLQTSPKSSNHDHVIDDDSFSLVSSSSSSSESFRIIIVNGNEEQKEDNADNDDVDHGNQSDSDNQEEEEEGLNDLDSEAYDMFFLSLQNMPLFT